MTPRYHIPTGQEARYLAFALKCFYGLLLAGLVLCATLAFGHTIVVLWTLEEQHLSIEEVNGEVVTNQVTARVVFWFADAFSARYQSACSLPWGYSQSDLSNAVATGAAQLATSARVSGEVNPVQVVLP